jgi:TolA-binding protein
MKSSGNSLTAVPSRGRLSFFPSGRAALGPLILAAAAFSGCSQMTLLRTHELRQVQTEVAAARQEVAGLQKSVDDLNLQQGGSTSKMRADLTSMLTDLQGQISRLHAEIDETQHRLTQLNQKLDRLDQRKIVASPSGADSSRTGNMPGAVKVVPGLDLEHMFGQAREDFIRGRYDLAYQGFRAIYEKDDAGNWREQSLFWMAECLWRGDKPDRAIELYQRVGREFPAGSQKCAAWLKLGLIHDQQQDIARRNEVLNQLIAGCPQSNEAARAREILKP